MSNKLKYIIFFGAIFGLLGFAHSIRCSDTPIISSLVGWLTICTATYYFAHDARFVYIGRGKLEVSRSVQNLLGASLAFSALQHFFIITDAYWIESVTAALFFLVFYYFLGKAVDG